MHSKPLRSWLQLHWLVFLLAFTAILGHLITLDTIPLVVWRTLIAASVIALFFRSKTRPGGKPFRLKALLTGFILGAHWLCFFGAVKISNVSICLVGLATISIFTSLTEAIQERRKPYPSEVLLGLIIIPSILLIAGVEQKHWFGLSIALLSALFAACFSVINKVLVRQGNSSMALTMYEMIGACILCLTVALVWRMPQAAFRPQPMDFLWLGLLAIVCTVYAYSLNIRLLRVFSAFESNLAINFEPVYGIILASFLFHENRQLHPFFFVGAAFIILANFAQPLIRRWRVRRGAV